MGVLDRIEQASLATQSVTLYLEAGLQGEYQKLALELEGAAAMDEKFGSLAMEHTTPVVEKMDALRDRMLASKVTFEFRALEWTKRLALQAQHPPRKNNFVDQLRGHNADTFTPAIIKATCVSVTDADGDTATKVPAKTWAALFRKLNFGQMSQLYNAAWLSNDDAVNQVPISARFLLESRDSEASLVPPVPGTPASSGGAGGSRRTSRKSSATKKAASSAT